MKDPKVKNQVRHSRRRFKQRLGIDLTPALYKDLLHKIQTGSLEMVEKQSNRVSVFKASINGENVRVVYDKNTKALITVLF